ncbi:hypothetical protein [Sphingomonas sp.]|uniref:hypothetical protein n=1 Tax=Sphingomonas sp. TaxID=28214 RepID=UPI002DD6A11C|nr:hypothetical protein [Sphingomonas sp.]
MPIPQSYFELRDVPPLQGRSWIPLRLVVEAELEPPAADIVRIEEWTGIATAAVDIAHRDVASKMGWTGDLDMTPHRSAVERWGYSSVDIFRSGRQPIGINLVIDQHVEEESRSIWHLHPDLVVALGLVREEDTWFRPEEGWVEVARLTRDDGGSPKLLEIKAEFLRDYLAARGMALYCSSYRERIAVVATKPSFSWPKGRLKEEKDGDQRECTLMDADYPDPKGHFWVRGALWRTEWVEPGMLSTRVRGDDDPHTTTFALKNDGSRASAPDLIGAMAWLHFEPAVVAALLRHRGGRLRWATGETGAVGATASGVHFGVNDLGRITVFAKDIGRLQPWEQRVWSAHNATPDGGVSKELFAAQMEVNPAATTAPEYILPAAIAAVDDAFRKRYGTPLLRDHDSVPGLLRRSHRFLAADPDGLLELSKELTRVFIERIDVDAIATALALPKGDKKPGSLKALEKLAAKHGSEGAAATMMAPLFGIYDLRLADAHLGGGKIASGKQRAGVDDSYPPAMQGRQLIQSFVDALQAIAGTLV